MFYSHPPSTQYSTMAEKKGLYLPVKKIEQRLSK